MLQDEFMREYFKPNQKVTVDANELQALVRKLKEAERNEDKLRHKVDILETKISLMSLKEAEKPVEVKLDVKC